MIKSRILLVAVCIFLLTGCGQKSPQETSVDDKKDDSIQIGLSFDSFVIERWQRDRDVFVSTANELGAQVNVQNANGDYKEQIAQIEYFIEKEMDVITIIATDSDAMAEVVKKAKNAGIKVIAYDRLILNADVDLYITFDNEEVGRMMGRTLIKNTPANGNIAVIFGPETDHNVYMVEQGFNEVVSSSSLNIVYQEYAQGWLAEKAFDAVGKTLAVTDRIDGMLCGNDNLASQAIRALSEERMAGDVCVVGQDGDLDACQRIVEGTQTMTVFKSVEELAKSAAQYAVQLGKGDTITTNDTFFDGTQEVPYEKLMPVAVTKENIDKIIIEGGFHLREEVYLNIPEAN